MDITKDFIINFAKEYTNRNYNDEFYKKLSSNKKTFLSSLPKLEHRQIKEVLKISPQFSNSFSDGWHSVHYACLSNNAQIVSTVIDGAINQGITEYPTTQKAKRGVAKGVSLLNFCASLDLDESFATVLLNLSAPESQNFEVTLKYAFLYGSPKVTNLLKTIYPENFQKIILSSYCFMKEENKKVKNNFFGVFIDNFKYNPEKFLDYGIDINYKLENERTYFTNTLYWLNQYSHLIEDEMKGDKFKNLILFFLKNGENLDDKDGYGDSPRDLIKNIKNKIFDSKTIESIDDSESLFDKLSLNNKLNQSNQKQTTKLKI